MRRLLRLDKALLLVLVPLWGLCFVLYLDDLARGRLAWVPLAVAAPERPDGYPSVRGVMGLGLGWDAGDLRIGDRLLRLGSADLRGVGRIGFIVRAYEEAGSEHRVPVALMRDSRQLETWLNLRPLGFGWRFSVLTLPFVVMGVLIVFRLPGSVLARTIFLACLAQAFHWTPFPGGSRAQTYAWLAAFAVSATAGSPLMLRVAWLFPESGRSTRPQLPAWHWAFALTGPIVTSGFFGVPWLGGATAPAFFLVGAGFSGALVVLGTRAFLRADPIGRRQIKWALYGVYIGFVPLLVTTVLGTLGLVSWRAQEVATIAIALAPLCGFIAIVRFDFLDIDRLISTTAAYSVLSVLLLAAALVLIPRLSEAITTGGVVEPVVGQSVLALLLAGMLIPARRYLRPQIERVFFAERHALEAGASSLLRELSTCGGPQELFTRTGNRLDELLRPDSCVIYARAGHGFVPVFVHGHAVPVAHDTDDPLIAVIRRCEEPLTAERWSVLRDITALSPFERAVLETLGGAVVLPIRRGDVLSAFISLGEKQSGDVYTSTDVALLLGIAHALSGELLRFDDEEIIRQGRAMQEALRRYVPGSVAEQIASGQALESAEREVTVLFVDIRGHMSYAETRKAAEVFSTINRYTETVSRAVSEHGGTVVEFNGDGMMAVFGAPEVLPQKERAAVEAGREILAAVRSLVPEPPRGVGLAVGVGIATGTCFVGNVQAVDRFIWTAIGNTPNRAARLQSLTRELNADMVIDAATSQAALYAAADFVRRERVPIRGLSEPLDVFLLESQAVTRT